MFLQGMTNKVALHLGASLDYGKEVHSMPKV